MPCLTCAVNISCDPVNLKETGTLSKVEIESGGHQSVKEKTTIRHITVELSGPAAVVEAWSKTVDTGKILALPAGAASFSGVKALFR